jgi:hypothetical protein
MQSTTETIQLCGRQWRLPTYWAAIYDSLLALLLPVARTRLVIFPTKHVFNWSQPSSYGEASPCRALRQ